LCFPVDHLGFGGNRNSFLSETSPPSKRTAGPIRVFISGRRSFRSRFSRKTPHLTEGDSKYHPYLTSRRGDLGPEVFPGLDIFARFGVLGQKFSLWTFECSSEVAAEAIGLLLMIHRERLSDRPASTDFAAFARLGFFFFSGEKLFPPPLHLRIWCRRGFTSNLSMYLKGAESFYFSTCRSLHLRQEKAGLMP